MDQRLLEVVRGGDVAGLRQLLVENPDILVDVAVMCTETPLHIAAKLGHADLAREIVLMKPAFAGELNHDGVIPLHLASAMGHLEIVRELVMVSKSLCFVKDKYGRTALHWAAMRGRLEVMGQLFCACPESQMERTPRGETLLHLAVLHNQCEAFRVVVGWLNHANKEDMINSKDREGNTVLHLAASMKQLQIIEMILSKKYVSVEVEVNAVNASGFTALDILNVLPQNLSEMIDKEIYSILLQAGALRARDILAQNTYQDSDNDVTVLQIHPTVTCHNSHEPKSHELPLMSHNGTLVIALLTLTVTFSAVYAIPGGLRLDYDGVKAPINSNLQLQKDVSGTADQSMLVTWFILFNSAGFFSSAAVILRIVYLLPLKPMPLISVSSLIGSYMVMVLAISPRNLSDLLIIAIPVALLTTAFCILPSRVWSLGNLSRRSREFHC